MIHSIWQVEGFTSFQNEIIIPKGVAEIIFNFNDPVAAQINDKPYQLPGCFINGFNTGPIHLRLPEFQHFFGVVYVEIDNPYWPEGPLFSTVFMKNY